MKSTNYFLRVKSFRKSLFAVSTISLLVIAACNGNTTEKETTLGQDLATIEAGAYVPANDPYVNELNNSLNTLASKYDEPKEAIADFTEKTRSALQSGYGVKISSGNLMREIIKTDKPKGASYKDMLTLYGLVLSKNKE